MQPIHNVINLNWLCSDIQSKVNELFNLASEYEDAVGEKTPHAREMWEFDGSMRFRVWLDIMKNHFDEWVKTKERIDLSEVDIWLKEAETEELLTSRLNHIRRNMKNQWSAIEHDEMFMWLMVIRFHSDVFARMLFHSYDISKENAQELSSKWLKSMVDFFIVISQWQSWLKLIIADAAEVPTLTSATQTEQTQEPYAIPELFTSKKAQAAFKPAINAGLIDAVTLQPIGKRSDAYLCLLAVAIMRQMGMTKNKWQPFEKHWGIIVGSMRKEFEKQKTRYVIGGEDLIFQAYPNFKR